MNTNRRIGLIWLFILLAGPVYAQCDSIKAGDFLEKARLRLIERDYSGATTWSEKARNEYFRCSHWRGFIVSNNIKGESLVATSSRGKAIDLLEATLELVSDKVSPLDSAWYSTYVLLGRGYASRTKSTPAVNYLQTAQRVRATDSVRIALGQVFVDIGRFDSALALYESMIREDSTRSDARDFIAWAYAAMGDYGQMIAAADRALELDSSMTVHRYNKAFACFKLGDFRKADSLFRAARSVDIQKGEKKYENVAFELARLVFQKEPDRNAERLWKESLGLGDEPMGLFVAYDEPPQLIGGYAFIRRHLKYPEPARQKGIEGKVLLKAIVSERGEVVDVDLLDESPEGYGFGTAGKDVIYLCRFQPAKAKGKGVKVSITIPITFRLKK
jgi:TonB family protein